MPAPVHLTLGNIPDGAYPSKVPPSTNPMKKDGRHCEKRKQSECGAHAFTGACVSVGVAGQVENAMRQRNERIDIIFL